MAKERERTAEVTLNEGTPEEKKINIENKNSQSFSVFLFAIIFLQQFLFFSFGTFFFF